MKTTLVTFNLRAWRAAQHWTQAQAATALGLSLSAYRAAEYRSDDRGTCNKTYALLATFIARQHAQDVFVVMSNDYPDAVFATKVAAETYAAEQNRLNKVGSDAALLQKDYGAARRIYYSCYSFPVQAV